LAPLRALRPETDTLNTVPVNTASQLSLDPNHPVPVVGDGMLLARLPAGAIDTLVRIAGAGVDSRLPSVEIRQLGGELSWLSARPWCPAVSRRAVRHIRGRDRSHRAGRPRRARRSRACSGSDGAMDGAEDVPELRRDPSSAGGFAGVSTATAAGARSKGRIDPDDLIRSNPAKPAETEQT
ncbi:MAG: hypothetical protein ACRDPA_02270, partial [Solirubrobacteraceae bacterium]